MSSTPEILCAQCGAPAGCDSTCPECLSFLLEQGADAMDEGEARRVVEGAERWEESRGREIPSELLERVRVGASMVRDWTRGSYRQVPWRTIASLTAGLLYVINPFDLVPDFLTGIGFLDDASVMAMVFQLVTQDMEAYVAWRKREQDRRQASKLKQIEAKE